MWHASAALQLLQGPAPVNHERTGLSLRLLAVVIAALKGAGDASLGQWVEYGASAVHLRRRLSTQEEALVGPVIDVRNTEEGERRWRAAQRYLPSFVQREW